MKQIMMLLAAMLLTACSKNDEAKAATVQEAGKTLVVYYSYTNNCHEIVTSLTNQIQADVMRIEPADKTQKYEANNYAINSVHSTATENDAYYSLSGQRIENPTHGIYIKNGKKVIL